MLCSLLIDCERHCEAYRKGPIKENHVEEDCEEGDELEACRSYIAKVYNLWIIF